jgi:hypothetical protein
VHLQAADDEDAAVEEHADRKGASAGPVDADADHRVGRRDDAVLDVGDRLQFAPKQAARVGRPKPRKEGRDGVGVIERWRNRHESAELL